MVDQQHCLVESGQRLENVHQTHLTLARGNLVEKNVRRQWGKRNYENGRIVIAPIGHVLKVIPARDVITAKDENGSWTFLRPLLLPLFFLREPILSEI